MNSRNKRSSKRAPSSVPSKFQGATLEKETGFASVDSNGYAHIVQDPPHSRDNIILSFFTTFLPPACFRFPSPCLISRSTFFELPFSVGMRRAKSGTARISHLIVIGLSNRNSVSQPWILCIDRHNAVILLSPRGEVGAILYGRNP